MNLRPILFVIFVSGFCLFSAAESLTDSVRVHFRVNKTAIDTLLMGNDAAMRDFAGRMSDLSDSSDKSVTIDRILITGAASPEGSIAVNEHLSRERAAAITRWLKGYFEFPDSIAEFVFKGRDWHGLLRAVSADSAVPYKKEVVALLNDIVTCPPPRHLQA